MNNQLGTQAQCSDDILSNFQESSRAVATVIAQSFTHKIPTEDLLTAGHDKCSEQMLILHPCVCVCVYVSITFPAWRYFQSSSTIVSHGELVK